MKITRQLLEAGRSQRGGWNRPQLEALGIEWPPTNGWRVRLIGTEITEQQARRFIDLTGCTKRAAKKPCEVYRKAPGIPLPWPTVVDPKMANNVTTFWIYLQRLDGPALAVVVPILSFIVKKLAARLPKQS